jgi:hypothetical protein
MQSGRHPQQYRDRKTAEAICHRSFRTVLPEGNAPKTIFSSYGTCRNGCILPGIETLSDRFSDDASRNYLLGVVREDGGSTVVSRFEREDADLSRSPITGMKEGAYVSLEANLDLFFITIRSTLR